MMTTNSSVRIVMKTEYYEESTFIGSNDVVFLNEDGIKLVRRFDSPRFARAFANKVKRNKRMVLCTEPVRN